MWILENQSNTYACLMSTLHITHNICIQYTYNTLSAKKQSISTFFHLCLPASLKENKSPMLNFLNKRINAQSYILCLPSLSAHRKITIIYRTWIWWIGIYENGKCQWTKKEITILNTSKVRTNRQKDTYHYCNHKTYHFFLICNV